MKRPLLFFLILIIVSGSIYPFAFDLLEVVGFLGKISTTITQYSDKMDEYYEEFLEFYQEKWAKYYTEFSQTEIDFFDTWDTGRIYRGPDVDPDKMGEKWRVIFMEPKRLRKEFPDLFNTSHYKENPAYTSNGEYRKITDRNISDGFEYLGKIESLFSLLNNTRESQKIRGKKVVEIKGYIKNFAKPRGRNEVRMGRLIGIEVILDYEIEKQMTELISLINAQTEIGIISACMEKNMRNRSHSSRMKNSNVKYRAE